MEIKNAKIRSVHLGNFERFWGAKICFGYGDSGLQCVYFGMERIRDLLKVFELSFWESLPGTNCRVKASEVHVFEIGHFMKERWILI